MRRVVAVSAFIIVTFVPTVGQTRSTKLERETRAEEELMKLERGFGEALTRRDKAMLDRLMADDFVVTNNLGRVLDKQQILSELMSSDYESDSIVNDDISIRVFGDAAVVTARGTAKGRYKGRDASGQFRYTRVWIRREGQWQAVAAQSTNLPQ